ncbi:MAG: hypothetical protein FJY82_14965 [Candidatus Aminicenantes bacterium]|nr:hypothetical protein [Candidatus Aminicenantes bacterium]
MSAKRAAIIVALALFLALSSGLWTPVRGEEEAAICEKALLLCMTDPYIRAGGVPFVFYCIEGYAFCKKYVEPFLGQ